MYLNTRIFPTSGYARVLLFMFIRRELGGMVQDVYFSLHTVSIDILLHWPSIFSLVYLFNMTLFCIFSFWYEQHMVQIMYIGLDKQKF